MKLHDVKEVSAWALVTTVLAVGVLGGIIAHCADPDVVVIGTSSATIQGCKITSEVKAANEDYNVEVVIKAENPSAEAKSFDLPILLVRKDFTGSPLSRSFSPNDYKSTDEFEVTQHFNVAGNSSATATIKMPINARPSKDPKESINIPNYEIEVINGEGANSVITSSNNVTAANTERSTIGVFSAILAWPKENK